MDAIAASAAVAKGSINVEGNDLRVENASVCVHVCVRESERARERKARGREKT